MQLDVSNLKEQSWHRVCINKQTLTIGRETFSLETGKVLSTIELTEEEELLTSCCFDGSMTAANIIKTLHGLRIETKS